MSKRDRRPEGREYARTHRQKRAAYMRAYNARRIPEVKTEIFAKLGGRCANCGIDDERVLTIDHREGGGGQERRQGSGLNYYVRILRNLDHFRILCHNCNWLAHRYGPLS